MAETAANPFEDLVPVERPTFKGQGQHLGVRLMREAAVIKARELQTVAGQVAALLLDAAAENDAEIDRWLSVMNQTGADLFARVTKERLLRDIQGVA